MNHIEIWTVCSAVFHYMVTIFTLFLYSRCMGKKNDISLVQDRVEGNVSSPAAVSSEVSVQEQISTTVDQASLEENRMAHLLLHISRSRFYDLCGDECGKH